MREIGSEFSDMKRAIIVCTVGCFVTHEMNNIRLLKKHGYEVTVASNFTDYSDMKKILSDIGVYVAQVDFMRSPFSISNVKAYKQLRSILSKNTYTLMHCHTPMGGVVGRLAAKKYRKHGMKVIYTAHGFHFFSGAPLKNWLLYYPVEWMCAHWTDILITINKEDYEVAKKRLKVGRVEYVPGVGIDLHKFGQYRSVDKAKKRKELGIPKDAVLLLSVGELNENKNHETVIRAIAGMNIYYMIAGIGKKEAELKKIVDEVGMKNKVRLLGYRTDVDELLIATDIFIFPSYREGLPVSLMEAMASGLPCLVSKIRGNVDLIDENGGILFNPHNVDECREAIIKILKANKKSMGVYNMKKVQGFGKEIVIEKVNEIYKIVKDGVEIPPK